MSICTGLPIPLQEAFSHMSARARRLRLARGVSLLVATLSLLTGAALLADYLLGGLPWQIRLANLAIGSLTTVALIWHWLLRPLSQTLSAKDLAALVELQHPDLHERLLSSVELAMANGSDNKNLVQQLLDETLARTRSLNFAATLPARSAWRATGVSALALLVVLGPAMVAPTIYGDLVWRFLTPWKGFFAGPDYVLEVTPGDVVAARGKTVAIIACVQPREGLALPDRGTLHLTFADRPSSTIDMMPDDSIPGRYQSMVRVEDSGSYRIAFGGVQTQQFSIIAAIPTDLAADSPVITVEPPEYASSVAEKQKHTGLVSLTVFSNSRVQFHFAFDRPARSADFVWIPQQGEKKSFKISLDDNACSGHHTFLAQQSGTYRLILEGEHGLLTEREGGKIDVTPDRPPVALRPAEESIERVVRPGQSVTLEQRLVDDIALSSAELLTRKNDKEETVTPLTLDPGSADVVVRHRLALPGTVTDGNVLSYRIRFRDNRPDEFGGPQVAYYPENGWIKLKIDATAGEQEQKQILAQRDALDEQLEKIEAQIKQEKRRADKIRVETRDDPVLGDAERKDLDELVLQDQQSQRDLESLAQNLTSQDLAAKARRIASDPLKNAEAALRESAQKGAEQSVRDKRLGEVERELDSALQQLASLRESNRKETQARLDLARLRDLAQMQEELANKAAQDKDAEKLAEQQQQIAKQLDELTKNSAELKQALEAIQREKTREVADLARDLAQAQRDLAQASETTEKKRDAERLAELEKKQHNLERRAEALGQQTQSPMRANYSRPLSTEEAKKATQRLREGDAAGALDEQDRAARELDRMARDLERLQEKTQDPREAVRQLSRMQEDLARRVKQQVEKDASGLPQRLGEFHKEQEALRDAVRELNTPRSKEARAEQAHAADQQNKAANLLQKGDTKEALAEMEKARQTLRELAKKVPAEATAQDKKPALMPGKKQADEARNLAAQQRALRQQTRDAVNSANSERRNDVAQKESPTANLAQQQQEIAQQAGQLVQQIATESGAKAPATGKAEMARDSSADAARDLARGALEPAQKSGEESASALRRTAEELSRAKQSDTARKAEKLAQKQESLNKQLAPLAKDTRAQRQQQLNRQEELSQKISDLTQRLSKMSPRAPSPSQKQAAESARKAETSAKAACQMCQQGDQSGAQGQREQAAKALDQSANQADASAGTKGSNGQAQGGKAVRQAQQQMAQAQGKLQAGKPGEATPAMQNSAQLLQQAADQLARAGQSSETNPGMRPNRSGITPSGKPDSRHLPKELLPHVGKRWGELPGELRTRMVQQMQSRYGEEYARSIKLYFEQLADTRKR